MSAALRTTGRARVESVNLSSDLHPVLGPIVARAYFYLIQKLPGLWAYLYDNRAVAELVGRLRRFYLFLEGGKLRRRIRELSPDVIVCTHALSFFSIASEKELGHVSPPLVGVVTDFAVHAYWTRFPCELIIVPAEGLAQELRSVATTGIPIHPIFEEPLAQSGARQRLGLQDAPRVLLLSGGSKAIGDLARAAGALLGAPQAPALLVACGNNDALRQELEKRYPAHPRLHLYGLLEPAQMRELLYAADLAVGKAGGVSCAEALAAGLASVFLHPIPGQEERNVDYLTREGAALRARDVGDAVEKTIALLDDPPLLESMSRRAKALGRPGAAREAAEAILKIGAS